jgi:ankyrin repeat protein
VLKRLLRLPKRSGLIVVIFLAVAALGVGLYSLFSGYRSVREPITGEYEVQYFWDNGVRSLRIVNSETNAEVTKGEALGLVTAEAKRYLPGLVLSSGLSRAVGTLDISVRGDQGQYFANVIASTSDPQLIRDPDITPLMLALAHGDTSRALKLVAAGASLTAADQHGNTVLMYASSAGDTAIVRKTLSAGADVNAKNKNGESALYLAAFLGRVSVVRELIHQGVDVNSQDSSGSTALMAAASTGHCETVKALLKAHADVELEDDHGSTALSRARRTGHEEIIRVLREARAGH